MGPTSWSSEGAAARAPWAVATTPISAAARRVHVCVSMGGPPLLTGWKHVHDSRFRVEASPSAATVRTSAARRAMPQFRSQLSVPSHPDSATIASAYVRELVTLARLTPEQAMHLVQAATESCGGILGCPDAPGAQDPLDLVAIITPKALTLEIHERGAPFDPSESAGALAAPIRGPAWERI